MLRENPSGIDLGPLQPSLPERLRSPDQRIRCETPEALTYLQRLPADFGDEPAQGLRLIGRRDVRSNNSWMHNFQRLVKGKDRCTLQMHPTDMAERRIEDGSEVAVRSRVGEVRAIVETCEDIMPGVVSLPHGFGHHRPGTRMAIARRNAGVSCNDITDERHLDALSGNAAVNGVPVEVIS